MADDDEPQKDVRRKVCGGNESEKEGKNKKHVSLTAAQLMVQREEMNQKCWRKKSRSMCGDHDNKPSCSKTNSPYKLPATLKKAIKHVAAYFPKSELSQNLPLLMGFQSAVHQVMRGR
jgi:hypothetical protein